MPSTSISIDPQLQISEGIVPSCCDLALVYPLYFCDACFSLPFPFQTFCSPVKLHAMNTWEKHIADWVQQCEDLTIISCTAADTRSSLNAHNALQSPCEKSFHPSHPTPPYSTHATRGRKRKRSMASDGGSEQSGTTGLTGRTTTTFSLDDNTVLRPKTRVRSSSPARRTLLDLRRATPRVRVFQPDHSIYQPDIVSELRSRLIARITKPYIPAAFRVCLRPSLSARCCVP